MWMGKHFSERLESCKIPISLLECKQGNFRVAQIEYIIRKGKESKMDSVKCLRLFLLLWNSSFK